MAKQDPSAKRLGTRQIPKATRTVNIRPWAAASPAHRSRLEERYKTQLEDATKVRLKGKDHRAKVIQIELGIGAARATAKKKGIPFDKDKTLSKLLAKAKL